MDLGVDTWIVHVGVNLTERPAGIEEWRRYRVMARDPVEARLIAEQMAFCTAWPMKAEVISVEV